MILGSLVDAGLPLERLVVELRKLPVSGWELRARQVSKRGLAAVYLDAIVPGEDHHHHADHGSPHAHDAPDRAGRDHHHEGIGHRKLSDVLEILSRANFPENVERMAGKIYRQLAYAEGIVHGTTADYVVFHEVGQVDAIIDIAGAALGLHLLGIDAVYCSALPCGNGRIKSAHGEFPSPAPATMELLRDKPTYQVDLDAELVTPTGAAILTSIASFEPRPPMTVRSIGYGSGRSDFPFPNVLRVLIGDALTQLRSPSAPDEVTQIETNIDDMNPQLYEHVMERLFAAGALDVWTAAASMKKGRPGIVLCALAPPERAALVAEVVLAETTSIGVRSWPVRRLVLPRRVDSISTSLGSVRVKTVESPSGTRHRPEFEDCRAIAQREGLPLADVMQRIELEIAGTLDAQRT